MGRGAPGRPSAEGCEPAAHTAPEVSAGDGRGLDVPRCLKFTVSIAGLSSVVTAGREAWGQGLGTGRPRGVPTPAQGILGKSSLT